VARGYKILARIPVPLPRRAAQIEKDTDEFDICELTIDLSDEETRKGHHAPPLPADVYTNELPKPSLLSHEFRVSLRTILILTFVACVLLAVVAWMFG
jgi:hypothetical protein